MRKSKINEMTLKQFLKVPFRKDWNEEVICDALVILPCEDIHDSDYRCMDFVAIVKDKPLCRLAGGSDVLHVDGIGGYGKDWLKRMHGVPDMKPVVPWTFDCLKVSGLLRLFAQGHKIICDSGISSFCIYAIRDKK